jgi:DNA-binding transcriptional ArsR family regulator
MTRSSYDKKRAARADQAHVVIKILSNANRFAIMKLLLTARRDLCVHELSETIGISQSATSHQLAYLEAHGVITYVRMGKTKCYMPTRSALAKKIAGVIRSLA